MNLIDGGLASSLRTVSEEDIQNVIRQFLISDEGKKMIVEIITEDIQHWGPVRERIKRCFV